MSKYSKINKERLDWAIGQPVDVQLSLLNHHLDLCKLLINYILEQDVHSLTGEKYKNDSERRYTRWGSNPSSVKLGDQRLPVQVPRVYDKQCGCHVSLESHERLRELPVQDDQMVRSVLHGLSTRDYGQVAEKFIDNFGLSSSSVSRNFIEYSKRALEAFEKRKFEDQDFVAVFIDGKHLAKEQMIIALGVTIKGDKIPLGVIQSTTENATAIKGLLTDLINRGLNHEDGLLFIIDGAKGMRKAIDDVFGHKAVIQRCQWHKRENVVSYLNEKDQITYRRKLQKAYSEDDYNKAKQGLNAIKAELGQINRQAANSLREGMEETLTIQRLGLHEYLSKSFTTTNCIESVNSQLVKYIRKVKRWMNSDQRHRWVVCGLLEIEIRLRKVNNFQYLNELKEKLKNYVKITEEESLAFSTKNET